MVFSMSKHDDIERIIGRIRLAMIYGNETLAQVIPRIVVEEQVPASMVFLAWHAAKILEAT